MPFPFGIGSSAVFRGSTEGCTKGAGGGMKGARGSIEGAQVSLEGSRESVKPLLTVLGRAQPELVASYSTALDRVVITFVSLM